MTIEVTTDTPQPFPNIVSPNTDFFSGFLEHEAQLFAQQTTEVLYLTYLEHKAR